MDSIVTPPTLVKLSARSWKSYITIHENIIYSWWLPSFYIFRKKFRFFFFTGLWRHWIFFTYSSTTEHSKPFFNIFLRGLCCGATWRPPGIYSSPAAAASVRGRARKPQVRPLQSEFWTQLKNRAREWNNCALLSGALQYLKCREKTYLIYLVLVLVNRTEQIDILSVMRQRNGKHCVVCIIVYKGTRHQSTES